MKRNPAPTASPASEVDAASHEFVPLAMLTGWVALVGVFLFALVQQSLR